MRLSCSSLHFDKFQKHSLRGTCVVDEVHEITLELLLPIPEVKLLRQRCRIPEFKINCLYLQRNLILLKCINAKCHLRYCFQIDISTIIL